MKCKKCNCEMQRSREIYTSIPPKYKYICPKCHIIEFENVPFYSSTSTITYPESMLCPHNFVINFVNGEYISVCTRCGKIGDKYSNPITINSNVLKESDE